MIMLNVLVDTSVWVAHFRSANAVLANLIERDRVLGHPMVLAEIACGTPPAPREQTLGDLALLRQAHVASFAEVMAFIEGEKLYGLGCGFVDIALLASTCITPDARLWTRDKKLMNLAERFDVQFAPPLH
jgi:predicted nucleic acid-binding protein